MVILEWLAKLVYVSSQGGWVLGLIETKELGTFGYHSFMDDENIGKHRVLCLGFFYVYNWCKELDDE